MPMVMGGILRLQRVTDRKCDAVPLRGLVAEPPPAGLGQRVKLGASIVFRRLPGRGQRAGFLEPVQGGEERSRLNAEGAAGDLLDAARRAEAVQLAGGERLQDEQIERALQNGRAGFRQCLSYRNTIGVSVTFLSNVNRNSLSAFSTTIRRKRG